MLKRTLVKFVRVSLKFRRNSWPPLQLQKNASFPLQIVDPADISDLGQVESKGDTIDRGETPSKKPKKSSHKSPSKYKTDKTPDFQTEVESMGDK